MTYTSWNWDEFEALATPPESTGQETSRLPSFTGDTKPPATGVGFIHTVAPAPAGSAVVPSCPRVTVQVLAATDVTVMVSPVSPALQTEMLKGVGGGVAPPATVMVVCAELIADPSVVLLVANKKRYCICAPATVGE